MYLACYAPPKAPDGLGFWDVLLSTAATVGSKVLETKNASKIANAQIKAQIDAQRMANEQQLKIAQLQQQAAQAALASQQGMAVAPAPVPLMQVGVSPTGQPQYAPRYDVVLDPPMPDWVIPAGVAAGVVVLALLLRR